MGLFSFAKCVVDYLTGDSEKDDKKARAKELKAATKAAAEAATSKALETALAPP